MQADALDEARERGGGDSGMKGEEGLLPDIRAFLRPVGVLEARYVRMLSSLSALTYGLDNLTVRGCWAGPGGCWVVVGSAALKGPGGRAGDGMSRAEQSRTTRAHQTNQREARGTARVSPVACVLA